METWDAIRSRRNIRSFAAMPIVNDDMNRILEAGWRTPSASNRQHWDFVVATERDQLSELATVWDGARFIESVPAVIAMVMPVPPDDWTRIVDYYDLGQATFAMMLAAADLGIGSGHSAVGDHEKAAKILNVPDTHRVTFMLALGYPAERPLHPIRKPDRRPFGEVVHHGTW